MLFENVAEEERKIPVLHLKCDLIKSKFMVNSAPTDPRFVHATVIVNNNLYVMGGYTNDLPSREFFSLDLSQAFDATTPPWKDLTEASPLPVLISWAKASSNTNNDTIFLFGGAMFDTVTGDYNLKNMVYTYDFKGNQWLANPPAFQGMAPKTRKEFASISDPLTGKLYIHGGTNLESATDVYYKEFFILDGNNLSWSQIGKTGPNMPPPRIDHATVLITNGVIVFIGGRDYNITTKYLIGLTLYDTKTDTWDLMTTVGGLDIDSRTGHTAIYAANGQIIVYGGTTPALELTPTPVLAVLDTTIKPFKWITPPVTTPEVPINPLTNHQADLIGDYMLITNGPTTILAIVVSVGFALIIAAFIGGFLLYCRNRQKKNAQELPSSFNDASSSAHSTQMVSPPPPSSSQGQINNNDNFMRSISTTTPSLISSSNSQNPSNHNSVYTLPMITTPPSTTPTTAINSTYGNDINNNNNFGNFGITPQINSSVIKYPLVTNSPIQQSMKYDGPQLPPQN
ncbi:3555_t:CDS:2 [Entrophospora sp. SA101]|nr:3555_t:CDS:2 [Entrophospora sp. SA101]